MKSTRIFSHLFVLLLGLGLLLPSRVTAAKDYYAERFDVDLEIQPDGALVVTETVVFRFEGGPFTYVFRDLAYNEIDQIDRLQASMDGAVLPQGTDPGQVEIEAGDPLKVTWHFAPTSDSTHTFTLAYRVQGAIRQLDGTDALIWRAVPEEHDYRIASSTITLRYPPSADLLQEPKLHGRKATVETSDGQAVFSTADIDEDEEVVVQALFAPGSVIAGPPAWQAQAAERSQQVRSALPLGLAAGLATLLAGAGFFVWYWRRNSRAQPHRAAVPYKPSEPPSEDPPAFGATLARTGIPPLATFFDLAQRGVLRIEEVPGRWDALPILAVLAGVTGALALVGLFGLIAATTWSTWTLEGDWQATAWKGFAAYLKNVARGKQVLVDTALFERYLPYAAGFGLSDSWARRYQKQSGLGVPVWFHALADADSSAAFVAVIAATHSSFGSSGGGAAGAAGA